MVRSQRHADWLARLRAARAPVAVRATGRITESSGTGGWRLESQPDGRFAWRTLAALPSAAGFDGESGWLADWTGWPNALDASRVDEECVVAWVWSGAWLDPRTPIDIEPVDGPGDPASRLAWYRLRRRGGVYSIDVALDLDSQVPVRIVWSMTSGTREVRLESHAVAHGHSFARRIVQTFAGRELGCVDVETIEPLVMQDDSLFAMPAPPDDWRYDRSRSADLEVRRAPTGHLLVHGAVAGIEGWFIFDSGAGGGMLARQAALRIGPQAVGSTIVGSIFGLESSPVYRVASIRLGPMTLQNAIMTEMDLEPFAQAFGEPVLGIVGWDILARAPVEVDAARPAIRILEPDDVPADVDPWIPLALHTHHPIVECRFEGDHMAWCRLDLGAGGAPPFSTIVFTVAAVERFGLLAGRETSRFDEQDLSLEIGTLGWLEWGGRREEDVPAGFMRSGGVLGADPVIAGNIGLELLARARLVFDYRRARIGFAPVR